MEQTNTNDKKNQHQSKNYILQKIEVKQYGGATVWIFFPFLKILKTSSIV